MARLRISRIATAYPRGRRPRASATGGFSRRSGVEGMAQPEAWLRGPIEGVPPLLQPVAHSLTQCREELERLLPGMHAERIWRAKGEAASIGFHVRHACGSLDRLFTYARGVALSE